MYRYPYLDLDFLCLDLYSIWTYIPIVGFKFPRTYHRLTMVSTHNGKVGRFSSQMNGFESQNHGSNRESMKIIAGRPKIDALFESESIFKSRPKVDLTSSF